MASRTTRRYLGALLVGVAGLVPLACGDDDQPTADGESGVDAGDDTAAPDDATGDTEADDADGDDSTASDEGDDGSEGDGDDSTETDEGDGADADAGGGGAGGSLGDACNVVTQADAERILEEPVEMLEPAVDGVVVSAECVWSNLAEDHGALLQFRVFEGSQFFQKEAFSAEPGFEEIGEVGDDAYALATESSVTLNVLVGERVVQIDASKGGGGFDASVAREQSLELAARTIDWLG